MTASPAVAADHPWDAALPARVVDALEAYLAGRRQEAADVDGAFAGAVGALVEFVLRGGKRIRPTFAWWGWRGAGGDPGSAEAPAVLRAVSALELVQACALIHDDVMDGSTTRRGRPTVHVDFADRHRKAGWLGTAERFGVAASVLLGDLALAWADDMLHSAGLDPDAADRAAPHWRAMRTEVLAGQYLDVLHQATGDSSPEAALQVCRYKTAAYTVQRPLLLGASLADAPTDQLAAHEAFGADIGVAFQLRDDLLGVFGDPAVTGKPAGDDLREGKRTYLVALALRRAEQTGATAAARAVTDALGTADLEGDALDRARSALVQLGAVADVERRIDRLVHAALDRLATAGLDQHAADRLTELAGAASRRTA